MTQKIILDTNFLLIPYNFKVNIFEELTRIIDDKFQLYIIDKTLDELNNIILKQKGKDRKAAEFAVALLNSLDPEIIETEMNDKSVDDEILALTEKDYVVATQDAGLKTRLKARGTQIIVLRQKSHLAIISS